MRKNRFEILNLEKVKKSNNLPDEMTAKKYMSILFVKMKIIFTFNNEEITKILIP